MSFLDTVLATLQADRSKMAAVSAPKAPEAKAPKLVYDATFLLQWRYSGASLKEPAIDWDRLGVDLMKVSPKATTKTIRLKSFSVAAKEPVPQAQDSNGWRKGGGQDQDQDVVRRLRGILNKLTTSNFDRMLHQVSQMNMETEVQLTAVIRLMFEKAVEEPFFSANYAKMCHQLSSKEVSGAPVGPGRRKNLRRFLLEQCQCEFEKDREENESIEAARKDLETVGAGQDRVLLEEKLRTATDNHRRRTLGNVKFIGELYKVGMIANNVINRCIKELLKRERDEEALESLCRLMTTIGPVMDRQQTSNLNTFFEELQLLKNRQKVHLSNRTRFMIQDLIDLKNRQWVSRQKTNQQQHQSTEATPKSTPNQHAHPQLVAKMDVKAWKVPKMPSLDHDVLLAPSSVPGRAPRSVPPVTRVKESDQLTEQVLRNRLKQYFLNGHVNLKLFF